MEPQVGEAPVGWNLTIAASNSCNLSGLLKADLPPLIPANGLSSIDWQKSAESTYFPSRWWSDRLRIRNRSNRNAG